MSETPINQTRYYEETSLTNYEMCSFHWKSYIFQLACANCKEVNVINTFQRFASGKANIRTNFGYKVI